MGDPLHFILGASSACTWLVTWGSRGETMWKVCTRRKCSESCAKLKAASPASFFSAVPCNSLSSVKQHKPWEGRPENPPWVLGGSRVPGLLRCHSDSAASSARCWVVMAWLWPGVSAQQVGTTGQCRGQGGLALCPLAQCYHTNLPGCSFYPSVT